MAIVKNTKSERKMKIKTKQTGSGGGGKEHSPKLNTTQATSRTEHEIRDANPFELRMRVKKSRTKRHAPF